MFFVSKRTLLITGDTAVNSNSRKKFVDLKKGYYGKIPNNHRHNSDVRINTDVRSKTYSTGIGTNSLTVPVCVG
jgi:hypothetical protein